MPLSNAGDRAGPGLESRTRRAGCKKPATGIRSLTIRTDLRRVDRRGV